MAKWYTLPKAIYEINAAKYRNRVSAKMIQTLISGCCRGLKEPIRFELWYELEEKGEMRDDWHAGL